MDRNYVYINDRFIAAEQASLLVSDLAIQRGYGIFDFCKSIGGKVIFLQDHLERFYHSAAKMHLQIKETPAELELIIRELQQSNNLPDSGIRLTLTGGYSEDGYTLAASPNLVITQKTLTIAHQFEPAGIKLVTYPYQRQLAAMKTLDYSMAVWLQPFVRENQADDVLYHHEGLVKECPRANFFIVNEADEILTAKTNVLAGVIRKNLLLMEQSDFVIRAEDFSLEDLMVAKEAFITSTTKNVLPVLEVNGQPVGDGKAGKITAGLAELLLQKIRHY